VRFPVDKNAPPREVWRRPIGAGWSSFIAVGDYLFTQEQRGDEELVTCYEASTGAPVWKNAVQAAFKDSMGLGPRATPAYAGGRLYTQGCTGILQCLDAATGETLWRRDLKDDAERDVPMYGFCSSPLAAGPLVIAFAGRGEGNGLIAYDRITGEEAWRAGELGGGYCSPMIDVVCGAPQVVMASNGGLEAFAPETGNRLWAYAWKSAKYPRSVQPVVWNEEHVLLPATTGTGTRLVHVKAEESGWGADEVWTCEKFRPYFNNGVFHKGCYYGYDGERLACLDLETGERLWKGESFSGQLLLLADMDVLLVLSEEGEAAFVPAVPDGFSVTARFQAINGKTWNHPVIAHGRLYVRNAEEAACFELAGAE
jgi:outer membrane protein assembly factor BamB